MLKSKVLKVTLVLACIITLVMPSASTVVMAATKLTKESKTAQLQIMQVHEGGEEASGTLTDAQREYYDETQYGYTIGNSSNKEGSTRVYKIVEKGDTEYTNSFYCLDATKSFPGVNASGKNYLDYTNVAEMSDSDDINVQSLYLSTSYSKDSSTWNSNYKAVMWLINNMFIKKLNPENKDSYLAAAFKDYDEDYDLETVKALLTDDDIDVVQQYAIWHFTNGDNAKFSVDALPSVRVQEWDLDAGTLGTSKSYKDINDVYAYRQDMADHLYQYLITSATEATKTETVTETYPTVVDMKPATVTSDETDYIAVGPFKVTSGNVDSSKYELKLYDQNEEEVTNYKVKYSIEGSFVNKTVSEIFDTEYYIYIPKTNTTTTKLNLTLTYSTYETNATLWTNNEVDENNVKVNQPLVLITKDSTPFIENVAADVERKVADLALRKYITKVNTTKVDRKVQAVIEDGAIAYYGSKEPVSVKAGDTITYEIRVYNEGDVDAKAPTIVDALPNGLTLKEDSNVNTTYGWTKTSTGSNLTVYSTDYLTDTTLDAFDGQNVDSAYVLIECVIADDAKAASVLTNIAEISADEIDDNDSQPASNDYINKDYDTSDYTGDKTNPEDDLDREDYYYKGIQDDDDFEKVVVEPEEKTFDLNLKKFVSKVNNVAPTTSREPKVDVTPLKNGKTDATYTVNTSTPVSVNVGDIVTYTIRVYNEGEVDGYAEVVSDYLPEGLGFLVNYIGNNDNYWSLPDGVKTMKLSEIENGASHLSTDDFTGVTTLNDVIVVKGGTTITSTKLKSSLTDTKNQIKAFDKENGTTLDYKDIQVTCIVLSTDVTSYPYRNIAEIDKDSTGREKDSDGNEKIIEVEDRDSTPDSVDPSNYPGDDKNQDDNDTENLTLEEEKEFDLSLQKYITAINTTKVTDRVPTVTISNDGIVKVTSSSNADPVSVANNDLITYTIRVYNEGEIAGYASEIADDLPDGLKFVTDNETNKKYGWKLYDKNGKETSDLSQAVTVRTDYLSKAKCDARGDKAIAAFDKDTKTVDFRDVEIVFQVSYADVKVSNRIVKNIAEITADQDENGNEIEDRDSKPNNGNEKEDDIDNEQVYVKYFDLSLQKYLSKIIVTDNGTTTEINVSSTDSLQKVEVHRKRISTTVVKFVYTIVVKNEGEIAGYATEIKDTIPDGLQFNAADNAGWTQVSTNVITTNALANTLLQPGQTASVTVTLQWINGENNFGLKTNVAEISAAKNDSNTPDIDSTPDNNISSEDDQDTAEVMLAISTGTAPTYIALTTTVLAIIATGVVLIKKYVLY